MQSIVVAAALVISSFGTMASIAPSAPPDRGARLPGTFDVRVDPSDGAVQRELRDTRRNIERRRESGELSKREARALRREARLIASLEDRYSRDGLSAAELHELQLRADELHNRSQLPLPRP